MNSLDFFIVFGVYATSLRVLQNATKLWTQNNNGTHYEFIECEYVRYVWLEWFRFYYLPGGSKRSHFKSVYAQVVQLMFLSLFAIVYTFCTVFVIWLANDCVYQAKKSSE